MVASAAACAAARALVARVTCPSRAGQRIALLRTLTCIPPCLTWHQVWSQPLPLAPPLALPLLASPALYLAGVRVVLRRTLTLSHTLPYLAGVVAAAAAGVPPCPTRQVWSLPLLLAPPLAPPLVASWLQRLAPPCALSPLASLALFGRLEGRAAARLHLIPPCLTRQARLPQLAPPSLALSRSLHLPYSAG